jgi:hypothetical protein
VDKARTALSLANPARRKRAFFAFLDSMTAAQAPGVERLIFELNRQGIDLNEEWYAFIERWGEVDPAAALALMKTKRDAGEFEGMIQSSEARIFAGWSSVDPGAASQWLDSGPDGETKEALWATLIDGLAGKDLAAATALAVERTTPESRGHKGAMERLAEQAVRQGGVEGMHAWFASLPEASRRDASSHVHWRNMQASMEIGAAWLAEQATSPWRKDHSIRELAGIWSSRDPAAATRWTASLPPGEPGPDAYPGLRNSIATWTAKNPEEVSAWLVAQQDQPFYDTAAAGVALHYLKDAGDTDTAEKWLNAIRSPEIKEEVRAQIGQSPATQSREEPGNGQ